MLAYGLELLASRCGRFSLSLGSSGHTHTQAVKVPGSPQDKRAVCYSVPTAEGKCLSPMAPSSPSECPRTGSPLMSVLKNKPFVDRNVNKELKVLSFSFTFVHKPA